MRLLTAKDIAAEIGCSLSFAYDVMKQAGRIVSPRGGLVRVSRANFEAWKRRH